MLFLKTKEKMKGNLASRPLDFYFLLNLGPWPIWGNRGGSGRRNPVPAVTGGEGEQGEEQEDVERDL